MAYTFDRINSLFNREDGQNANVIGDTRKSGGYGTLKTSATGDITSGSSGSATASGGEQVTPQGMIAPSGAAIKRNVGRTQVPGFAQRISGELDTASTGLQNEAGQYRQKYENQSYGVSPEDIKAAVEGNQEKLQQVQARYQQPKYGQVEAFAPTTKTANEDAAVLGSEGGTQRLLAREAGGRYTPGESAFDLALLKKNPNFNQIVSQIGQKQGQLSREEQRLRTDLPKTAQETADTRYEAGTKALKEVLTAQQTAALKASQDEAAKVNAERAKLRSQSDTGFISDAKAKAMEAAKKDINYLNPRATRFLETTGIDPTQFYGVGKDISADDVIAAEDAAKFNRIQQILQSGQTKQAGLGAGANQFLDVAGLQQALTQSAVGQRNVEDQRLRDNIEQMKGAAQARANEYNKRIAGEEGESFNRIRAKLLGQNPNLRQDFQQSFNALNPADFIAERSPVDYQDVYTKEEADAINAALADLGDQTPRVATKDWNRPVSVNEQAMQELINNQLAKEEELRRATGNPQRTEGGGVETKVGTSQTGAAADYLKERGEAVKDYFGKRNPFRK